MAWYKIRVSLFDGVSSSPPRMLTELVESSLPMLMQKLAQLLLEAWEQTEDLAFCDLISMLAVQIELTTWTCSKSCEQPGPEAQRALQMTQASVSRFLFSGVGSLWDGTPTEKSDSSPK